MELEESPQVQGKLLFFCGREEKQVDDGNQQHRRDDIGDTQPDQCIVLHGHGRQNQCKTGGENGLHPCAGGGAVHEEHHEKGKGKLHGYRRQKRLCQRHQKAAKSRTDGTSHQTMLAVLKTGLEQQKCVQREPVYMVCVGDCLGAAADGQHHGKLQGKPGFDGMAGNTPPEFQPCFLPVYAEPLEILFLCGRVGVTN